MGRNPGGKDRPSVAGLLYRMPSMLGGKAAAPSIVEFLAGVPAFQGVTRKELNQLASVMLERSYGDGESIFDQGTPSAAFYLIRNGGVDMFRSTGGTDVLIATLGPNEHFGELALLLDEAPRQISATSRGPSDLLALSRPDFETLIERSPVVCLKIFRVLSRVVALRFKMLLEAIEGSAAE